MNVDLHRILRKYLPPDQPPHFYKQRAQQTLQWCEKHRCELLRPPKGSLISQISNPPEILFVRGNVSLLEVCSIAVVGTRRPSAYGLRSTLLLSSQLGSLGFCIVSGLARGIDAASHRGAIRVASKTIAVLAHGLDRIYPPEHRELAETILESGGSLVSEYPPGVAPLQQHFPRRNRIISGLSVGVVVIEAGEKSGSLITANFAAEQGREVFVVSSRFDETTFVGSHRLIQKGAKLVTGVGDILEEFPKEVLGRLTPLIERQRGPNILRNVFEKHDNPVTLEELTQNCEGKLPALLKHLEQAMEKGIVTEISPQHYVWVGG